jgi:hypothetical protein
VEDAIVTDGCGIGMEEFCIDPEGDDSDLAEIRAEAVPQC